MSEWIKEMQDNYAGNDGKCLISKDEGYTRKIYYDGMGIITLNGTFTTEQIVAIASHMKKYKGE